MSVSVEHWHRTAAEEQAMESGHAPLWRRLIELIEEDTLADAEVLDFGCNQGGFLRLLHERKGFKRAVGVDVASSAVATAVARCGDLPIVYAARSDLLGLEGRFHLAFSHEVIYLIADIAAHARAIYASLRPGGVYYAVTGCHSDNPEWAEMRASIAERTTIAPISRSLDDYAKAFDEAGFEVAARPFGLNWFVPLGRHAGAWRGVARRLAYYDNVKTCFRLVRPA